MRPGSEEVWDEIRFFNGRAMYYDMEGQPCSLRQWSELRSDFEARIVALDFEGQYEILTVWLGLDSDPIDDPEPLIFGSVIKDKGTVLKEIESPSQDAARVAHARLLEEVRSGTIDLH